MGENKLKDLKFTNKDYARAARLNILGQPLYFLVPVGSWILENEPHIRLLTRWRQANRDTKGMLSFNTVQTFLYQMTR